MISIRWFIGVSKKAVGGVLEGSAGTSFIKRPLVVYRGFDRDLTI